jgi:hypothetical protein
MNECPPKPGEGGIESSKEQRAKSGELRAKRKNLVSRVPGLGLPVAKFSAFVTH